MTRPEIRDRIRGWFGWPPAGSDADRQRRKAQRLERDAARWMVAEAQAARERREDEIEADEILRVRLEQERAMFPNARGNEWPMQPAVHAAEGMSEPAEFRDHAARLRAATAERDRQYADVDARQRARLERHGSIFGER